MDSIRNAFHNQRNVSGRKLQDPVLPMKIQKRSIIFVSKYLLPPICQLQWREWVDEGTNPWILLDWDETQTSNLNITPTTTFNSDKKYNDGHKKIEWLYGNYPSKKWAILSLRSAFSCLPDHDDSSDYLIDIRIRVGVIAGLQLIVENREILVPNLTNNSRSTSDCDVIDNATTRANMTS